MRRLLSSLTPALIAAGPAQRAPAPAGPSVLRSFAGEEMDWDVSYAGVVAGTAWARVSELPGGLRIEGGARNADWYGAIYSIDDVVISTWVPGQGSRRYETRFREGRFQQDQDIRISDDGISVARHQHFKDGWRDWTTEYSGTPGVEDPVSAIYRLRQLPPDTVWAYPVFSGSETWPLIVAYGPRSEMNSPALGRVRVQRLDLRGGHKGDVEQRGRFQVYVTDDARRIPVRMVIKTNLGAIKAELVRYKEPTTGPAAVPATAPD